MGEEEKAAAEEEKRTAAGEKPKAAEEKPKEGEEKKDGGGDGCEKKEGGDGEATAVEPPPPPPEEVVMKVYMHCEGCARKVRRSLKGFEGVDDVITDCKAGKVVAKGRKAAEDPLKVVDRVQRKTGRKVELISPPPPPPPPPKPEKKEEDQKKEEDGKPKPEEKKDEPQEIDVVLKVYMHCDACAQEIKKRILKIKGVQSAEPELKASQVTVKGVFDPPKLVEYIYKRTGKQAVVIKVEPIDKKPTADDGGAGEKKPDGGEVATDEKKSGEGEAKDEKKSDEKEKDNNSAEEGRDKDKKDEGGDGTVAAEAAAAAAMKVVELKKNEFYYYYPRYPVEYAHPPQFFSDENPNACSVM